ncbi:leucine-rich repeat protein [Anaerostipes sp.]|uniref:leucine-rich repeat protein n=1 Tax=Anaerostipes sp. TaxID=1872530 RepID=UPI0025C38E2D|nr:leucine-rich repeat protein [Anaerostipes sp.]MBS7008735.1 leucine-rich repeat protein [Anaerostipes sp.]
MKGMKRTLAFLLTLVLSIHTTGVIMAGKSDTDLNEAETAQQDGEKMAEESTDEISPKQQTSEENTETDNKESNVPATEQNKMVDSRAKPEIRQSYAGKTESDEAVPEEGDFIFSGGAISGLTAGFLNGLTEDQKQNIHLVIPEKINGQTVTSIAKDAFKLFYNTKYSGCRFVSLDFTNASGLTSIGENAFYGASGISGSLSIPSNVTAIGNHAFRDCTGFTGTLKLPSELRTIGDYAFFNIGLGGTLQIPDKVTSIGANAFKISDSSLAGFSGKLTIPASVAAIGTVAFSGNKNITSVVFEGNNLTQIPDSVFRYCGLNGAVVIPSSVQKIGKNVFDSTNLKTIYLPKRADAGNTEFISSGTFGTYSSSKLTAIVCDKEDFAAVCSIMGSQFSKKIGYEISVSFEDGGSTAPMNRLFNLPYNYVKDGQGVWSADSAYKFPASEGKKWGLTENAVSPVSETDVIKQDKLYPISALEDPVITFGDGIDKVYDGKPETLKVTASHPMAKPIEKAESGDVVFYYTWSWGTITSSPAVLKGFDANAYDVTDVREPRFTIACRVRVQACRVEGTKAVPFYTVDHDFPVSLRQAESKVNPVYPKGLLNTADGMPEIALSEGDTKGTISWDKGQSLESGEKEYKWNFVPEENAEGNYNYTVKNGTAVLHGADGKVFKITAYQGEHGRITPEGESEIVQGSQAVLRFKPEAGYRLESASVNGLDVTSQIVNDSYTIKNVQSDYKVCAVFVPLLADDIESITEQLPQIPDGRPATEEEKSSILDAKQHFEALPEAEQDTVSETAKKKLRNAIASLPQVEMKVSGSLQVEDKSLLLDNMTSEDAKKLQQNDSSFKIEVVASDTQPDQEEEEAVRGQLQGASVYKNLDIRVVKTVLGKNNQSVENLSVLNSPIRMIFNIPDEARTAEDGSSREFFVIRAHRTDGNVEAEVLPDLDDSDATVTVDSDKYSVYVIAYKDHDSSDDNLPGQTPAEKRYEVRFDSQGGSKVPGIKNIKYGEHIQEPPAPNRDGYVFDGWYLQKECKNQWDFEKNIITGNRVLYAGWKKANKVKPSLNSDKTAKTKTTRTRKAAAAPDTGDDADSVSVWLAGASVCFILVLMMMRRKKCI